MKKCVSLIQLTMLENESFYLCRLLRMFLNSACKNDRKNIGGEFVLTLKYIVFPGNVP